jgi:DnaJ-class molecular chaperone
MTRKVILCADCEGQGVLGTQKCSHPKDGYYTVYKECWHCDGTGRMIEVTDVIPFEQIEAKS